MNKKGFTLIELLAVIVILAVISLIVTPVVSGIISSTKGSANMRSAEGYVTAVKTRLLSNMLGGNKLEDGLYTVDELQTKNIEFNGAKPTSGDVAILNGQVVSAELVFDNKSINVNSFGIASTKSKVYGLKWDGNDHYSRLNDAVGMTSCVGTDTEACVSDFDSAEIYNEIHDVYVDGNAFVYIPKFYIKKIVTGDTWEWYISKIKQDDNYYLPECFHDTATNRELPYVLIGKYDASLSDDGTKLESKSGVIPLVSKTINEFRTYALANNNKTTAGYQLIDIHTVDVLQVLFYIEYGTLNSQKIMSGYSNGQDPWNDSHKVVSVYDNKITITSNIGSKYRVGQLVDVATIKGGRDVVTNLMITAINGDELTVEDTKWTEHRAAIKIGNIIYNDANINGQTNNVHSKSGSIISNKNGEYSMKYREIENLYGGLWQFIDGVNVDTDTSTIYVNRNPKTYASNIITGDYTNIGYSKLNIDGWITKMGYDSSNPFANFPVAVDRNSSSKYGDYYFQSNTTGKRIVFYGGLWANNEETGISFFYLKYGVIYYSMHVGSRLIKTAL